jgi:chromosome segregation ATPase
MAEQPEPAAPAAISIEDQRTTIDYLMIAYDDDDGFCTHLRAIRDSLCELPLARASASITDAVKAELAVVREKLQAAERRMRVYVLEGESLAEQLTAARARIRELEAENERLRAELAGFVESNNAVPVENL